MSIIKKFLHLLDKYDEEIRGENNITRVYRAWKNWRHPSIDQEPKRGVTAGVARVPEEYGRSVARVPANTRVSTPDVRRDVARVPSQGEIMPRDVRPSEDNLQKPIEGDVVPSYPSTPAPEVFIKDDKDFF